MRPSWWVGVSLKSKSNDLGYGDVVPLWLINVCVAVMLLLSQVGWVAAAENMAGVSKSADPVLGDRAYRLDQKYSPIYGSPRGKSFFLHYCMPGFYPRRLGECELGRAPGSDPSVVQVHYKYSLGGREVESARVEGGGAYLFPFPVNVNLEGKTPYVAQYRNRSEMAKNGNRWVFKVKGERGNRYEGLDLYESSVASGAWWVPRNINEYRTRLGNPPIFVCGNNLCYLTLDQGDGWVVSAIFNESNLSGWREFLVQFNNSIKIVMEK